MLREGKTLGELVCSFFIYIEGNWSLNAGILMHFTVHCWAARAVQKGFLVVSEYNGEPQILKLKCKPNTGLFSLTKRKIGK